MKAWRLVIPSGVLIVHGTHQLAKRIAQTIADKMHVQVRLGAEPSATKRAPVKRAKKAPRRKRAGKAKRRNPHAPVTQLEQAVRTHKLWNGFAPQRVTKIRTKGSRTIPRVLVPLGELVEVVYSSDKFDGERREYVHRTKKPRPLLCTGSDREQVFIVGGGMKVTARGLVG